MISETRMNGVLNTMVLRVKRANLSWRIHNTFRWAFIKGWLAFKIGVPIAKAFGLMSAIATLEARVVRADGEIIDFGVLGHRLVTTAFVNLMVDNLIVESTAWGDFRFHDSGVGVGVEAVGNTDIGTTDGEDRVSGTQVEAAANEYRSVATIVYSTIKAITEHGLFNHLTTGVLMDRTVFAAINVGNGDSIQFTYTLTCNAGG